MNAQLKAQYELVNKLAAEKDALVGEDPYREMDGEEFRQLIIADYKLKEARSEMVRLEKLDDEDAIHPGEQADF